MSNHQSSLDRLVEFFHRYDQPRRTCDPLDQIIVVEHHRLTMTPHIESGRYQQGFSSFQRLESGLFEINNLEIGDAERCILFEEKYWDIIFLSDHIVVLKKKPKYRRPSMYPAPGNVYKYTFIFPG